jgi:hypothetical protein
MADWMVARSAELKDGTPVAETGEKSVAWKVEKTVEW